MLLPSLELICMVLTKWIFLLPALTTWIDGGIHLQTVFSLLKTIRTLEARCGKA